jgi:hypothetical protein
MPFATNMYVETKLLKRTRMVGTIMSDVIFKTKKENETK